MKTITLDDPTTTASDLLLLADEQNIVVRTPAGRFFVIAALGMEDDTDDFAEEIAAVRQNKELMSLLDERSQDLSRISAAEARKRLGVGE